VAASRAAARSSSCAGSGRAPYLFSNAIPPVVVAAACKVIDLISESTERRDKLEWNTRYWRGLLTEAGFDIKPGESPIVPVMLYNAKLARNVSRDLFHEGIYVVGFFFPGGAQGSGAHPHPALGRPRQGAPGQGDCRLQEGWRQVRHPRLKKDQIVEKYGCSTRTR